MKDLTGVTDLIKTGGKIADKLHTSAEEEQQFISDRHKVDMASTSKLAQSVRPISLYISWSIIIALATGHLLGANIDPIIMAEFLAMHSTILSFYFYKRSNEKIAQKNASANIEIERMKVKATIKEDRRQRRADRKEKSSSQI